MGLVRARDTGPELVVRRLVHADGYRYRLYRRDLPGSPDLVFPSRHKVILVHGCFWHRHAGCQLARLPKSRLDFWIPKLEANRRRDARDRRALERAGWSVLVVWECQLARPDRVRRALRRFLNA